MRRIIEFWRAVEMFSPPAIPRARPAQRVFDVAPGEPLPWDPGHPVQAARLSKDQAWRHTVYVGLYPREAVFSALTRTGQLRGAPLGAERPAGFRGFGEGHPARGLRGALGLRLGDGACP
jgi:hypothetical protein